MNTLDRNLVPTLPRPNLTLLLDTLPEEACRAEWRARLTELEAWYDERQHVLARLMFRLSGADDGLEGLITLLNQSDDSMLQGFQLSALLEPLRLQVHDVCVGIDAMMHVPGESAAPLLV